MQVGGEVAGRTRWGLVLVFLVALGLRLGAIDHGMPANYVPDTHIVRSALGMAKDRDLVPEVGVYSTYPNLLPYMLLPVYAGEYGIGRLTGAWGGAQEFGNWALEYPEGVHLPARVLVAILSAFLPLVAFGAARAMGLGLGAWVAAWLAATGLLGVHFSTQERPWEPMAVFMLLAAWPAARYVKGAGRWQLVLSGMAAGLAFGMHQGGGAALLVTAVAWAMVAVQKRADFALVAKRLVVDGLVAVLAFGLVGLILGHPYLMVHGATETNAVVMGDQLEQTSGAVSIGGQGFVLAMDPASFVRQGRALLGYDPTLLLLGLGGLLFAWRKRAMWPGLALLFVWAGLFLFTSNDHVRYLLPLAGFLCLPAGLFVERISGRLSAKTAFAVFALPMLFPLVQAARLTYVLDQADVRSSIADELAAGLLPQDARLAIGRYGPEVPRSLASLKRLAKLRSLGARETYRLTFLEALEEAGLSADDPTAGPRGGAGLDVLYLSDYFNFEDRNESFQVKASANVGLSADELLAALGVTHVLFADKTPGDGVIDLLMNPGAGWEAGSPVPKALSSLDFKKAWFPGDTEFNSLKVLDSNQGVSSGGSFEARLPTELNFALTGIWDVDRPGPALYLFEVKRP